MGSGVGDEDVPHLRPGDRGGKPGGGVDVVNVAFWVGWVAGWAMVGAATGIILTAGIVRWADGRRRVLARQ